MAGFLGMFNYAKPGPGIPKDAPPRARLIVFLDIYLRKFGKLVQMNLLFLIFNLPAIFLAIFIIPDFFILKTLNSDRFVDFVIRFILGTVFICVPVITFGPIQAGFTYVLRNFAREEHAWVWWDFKENVKKNFKQGLIISGIDLLVVILAGISINFYAANSKNLFFMGATVFVLMIFVIYIMMHMYIYPMLVTFKLSIKQLYKNALFFTMGKFLQNLGVLILCLFLVLASFYFNTFVGFGLFILITMSTIGLITNFHVYPYIKKHMLDKVEQENDQQII